MDKKTNLLIMLWLSEQGKRIPRVQRSLSQLLCTWRRAMRCSTSTWECRGLHLIFFYQLLVLTSALARKSTSSLMTQYPGNSLLRSEALHTKSPEAQLMCFLKYAGTGEGFAGVGNLFDMAASTAYTSVCWIIYSYQLTVVFKHNFNSFIG